MSSQAKAPELTGRDLTELTELGLLQCQGHAVRYVLSAGKLPDADRP